MIEALKTRIAESDRPVGTKRPNLLKVPKEGHVYGLEVKKDPEGVGESKTKFLIFNLINSYKKLENSYSFSNCPASTRFHNYK